ncbi:MAG: hypothetical protein ABIJ15_01090 [bacterium]
MDLKEKIGEIEMFHPPWRSKYDKQFRIVFQALKLSPPDADEIRLWRAVA